MCFKVTINIFIFKKLKIKDEPEGVGPLSDPKANQPWVPVSPTLRTVPQRQHLKAPAPTTLQPAAPRALLPPSFPLRHRRAEGEARSARRPAQHVLAEEEMPRP